MTNEFVRSGVDDIVSRLAVDLQELKNLKIHNATIDQAIDLKEQMLRDIKEYLEKSNKEKKENKKTGL